MERIFNKQKTHRWIVVEGIDGTGKSTIAAAAAESVSGIKVIEEPSGTPEGRSIAALLGEYPWTRVARIMFYGGLVMHTYDTTIYPLMHTGRRVLSVRSFPSTFAYQGDTRERRDKIADMYADLLEWVPCPQIVLATCSFDTAVQRIEQRDGRLVGADEADELLAVHGRYHDMADRFSWPILDTNGSIEDATNTLVGMIT